MPPDPKRVKAVFLAAVELSSPTARASFVDLACEGDADLRGRVEALLRSHCAGGDFLGAPAAVVPDPDLGAARPFAAGPAGARGGADEPLTFLSPSDYPGALGRIGHYEVLQVLGRGGFGIVLRAFDDVLRRVVAVKVLAPHLAATSAARKRFLREAQSSAQVRHEHVVQVYGTGERPLPYIVMEFIPGETLQQFLDRVGPVEPAEVVRVGRQIAEGLAAAHVTGLIHRDVKPGNILLEGAARTVKLTDFGLARAADDASISQSAVVAGTPMYMAPEQARGEALDRRADLFSLGSVLYQMAAGHPPFRANGTLAVLRRVVEDAPRDIREVIPETPRWLCDVVAKLHAKSPDDRFQSAREVADVLAGCEAQLRTGTAILVESRGPRAKPVRAARRGWVVAAAVSLPLLALAVGQLVTSPKEPAGGAAEPDRTGGPEPGPEATPADAPPVWTVLRPAAMRSEGGASLRLLEDGSVLAGEKHPDGDVYALTFRELPPAVHALRLEALPHPSLPSGGPGRGTDRPFVLTTLRAELDRPGRGPVALAFARAWDDGVSRGDALPGLAVDADDGTGWSVDGGGPRLLFLELAEPAATAGATLRVSLEFKHHDPRGQLGRFRLSAAGEPGPTLDGWLRRTAARPAAEQVEEVRRELKRRNPGFDGAVAAAVEGPVVTGLRFSADRVGDVAPVRALRGLTALDCAGTPPRGGRLADLLPLAGLPLARLNVADNPVRDLSPLARMPLKRLWLQGTGVTDLAPLHGMPLEEVRLTPRGVARGLDGLRAMRGLKTIGTTGNRSWPAAEFWALHDGGGLKD